MTAAAQAPEPETLRLARQYSARGWSVVPVSPRGKIPAVTWAPYQSRLADEGELSAWFSTGGYGIGLVQGAVANTIVLDFDGELGHETRAALEREHGPLPHTVEALTPGGGCHVFLQHPGRPVPTRKGVRPGMDVRGDGGFVVASPSVHANSRRYEWDCDHHPEEVDVAPCPDWLVAIICDGAGAVNGGGGHGADAAVVHQLRAGPLGLPQAVVADGRETYMRDTVLAVLAEQCRLLGRVPTEEELFAAVWPQYSARVDFTRPGRGPDEARAKCRYTLGRLAKGALPGVAMPAGDTAGDTASGPGKPGRPEILHLEEVEQLPPPVFLIEGLLPAGGLSVIYGPPKSGKTFLALAQALHIASGRPWAGRAVRQGGVVYIAGEGLGGLGARTKAARAHSGIPLNIPFWVIRHAIDFTKPDAAERLVKIIREAVGDEPISLVVIDTLARAMPGADENSAQHVGLVIAATDRVRELLACAALAIHHQGKDEERGMRGSSSLRGAVDAAFRLTPQEGGKRVILRNEDQKDAEAAPDMVFEMNGIPIPGTIGKTSLVPVFVPDAEVVGGDNRPEPKGLTKRALEILVDVISGPESTFLPPLEGLPGGVRGVCIEVFRREYHARNPEREYEARKKALRRAVDDLIEMRRVATRDIWIWVVT